MSISLKCKGNSGRYYWVVLEDGTAIGGNEDLECYSLQMDTDKKILIGSLISTQMRLFPDNVAVDLFSGEGYWVNKMIVPYYVAYAVDVNTRPVYTPPNVVYIQENIIDLARQISVFKVSNPNSDLPIFNTELGRLKGKCGIIVDCFGSTCYGMGDIINEIVDYLLCSGGAYINERLELIVKNPETCCLEEVHIDRYLDANKPPPDKYSCMGEPD